MQLSPNVPPCAGTGKSCDLQSAFPHACGLYFRNGNKDFVVKVAQDVFHPPRDNWNQRMYYCIYEYDEYEDDEEYEYDDTEETQNYEDVYEEECEGDQSYGGDISLS